VNYKSAHNLAGAGMAKSTPLLTSPLCVEKQCEKKALTPNDHRITFRITEVIL